MKKGRYELGRRSLPSPDCRQLAPPLRLGRVNLELVKMSPLRQRPACGRPFALVSVPRAHISRGPAQLRCLTRCSWSPC